MMESTNLVTDLISILIRKHQLFFPETEDVQPPGQPTTSGDLIDFNPDSLRTQKSVDISYPDNEDDISEDPRSQVLELENELELQQQQIKDLQSKLEQERKVREMLVLRLADEQRARESAEDRLEKLQAAMEEFCAKYGSWEPTNS